MLMNTPTKKNYFKSVNDFINTSRRKYSKQNRKITTEKYEYDIKDKIKKIGLPHFDLNIYFGVLPANKCIPYSYNSSNPSKNYEYKSYLKIEDVSNSHTFGNFNFGDPWETSINFATSMGNGVHQGTGFRIVALGRDGRNNIIVDNKCAQRYDMCFEIDIKNGKLYVHEVNVDPI